MTRTERNLEERNDSRIGAAETSEELAKWRRLKRKNLNKLGLPKRRVSQSEQLAIRQRLLWQREKNHLSISPDREMGESQVPWRKRGDQSGSIENGGLHRKES